MGIICLKCDSFLNNNEEQENKPKSKEYTLPKQHLNDDKEEEMVKIEKDEIYEPVQPNNNIDNNNINDDNNNNNQKIKKNYVKSKTFFKKDFEIIEEEEELTNNYTNNYTNNNQENDDKKYNIILPTKKKDALTGGRVIFDEKEEEDEEMKQAYQRRRRRSTTLVEKTNLFQQLYSAEMNMPIPQESLVLQQKGNPGKKYIRRRKIGSGTFGTVYESKNVIFNNKVAMKIIPKDSSMDNELIKNEIDILKKLSHPNIVRIYEFFETNVNFCLINEFCPEGELYNYINNSKLNEKQLSVIFYQVFSGLNYLHQNNIIHRDLKPENILISNKEKDLLDKENYFWIKIIDFGTAKIFQTDKNENSIVGSPYYIAPEVLDKDYNEKCDTWSVGVILYMFLVSKPPFAGANTLEIIKSIKTKKYDEKNPKFLSHSEEVRDLISHLLEKDKNKRFSAKEALNHIWFKKFNGRRLFENFNEQDIQPYIDNLFNYTCSSKIQQLVIAFLVHNLPLTESSINIIKLYRYFNTSGDCELTKEELINGLIKFRKKEDVNEKVDNLFLLLDTDKNEYIECEEFLRACIDKKELLNDKYLKYAFKFLDKENKGLLNAQQIKSAFVIGENKLFEVAIKKVINELDENGDGMINFQEFKQLMLKTMN